MPKRAKPRPRRGEYATATAFLTAALKWLERRYPKPRKHRHDRVMEWHVMAAEERQWQARRDRIRDLILADDLDPLQRRELEHLAAMHREETPIRKRKNRRKDIP